MRYRCVTVFRLRVCVCSVVLLSTCEQICSQFFPFYYYFYVYLGLCSLATAGELGSTVSSLPSVVLFRLMSDPHQIEKAFPIRKTTYANRAVVRHTEGAFMPGYAPMLYCTLLQHIVLYVVVSCIYKESHSYARRCAILCVGRICALFVDVGKGCTVSSRLLLGSTVWIR